MNTPTHTNDSPNADKTSPHRVVHDLYKLLIEPISPDEDSRRREFIFNVIVTAILLIVAGLNLSVFYHQQTIPDYTGVGTIPFSIFTSFFAILLFISRKGFTRLASYIFIGLYFLGATYAIYRWSIELPLGTLSYAVIIVMAGIMVGSRFAALMTVIIGATFIGLGWLQVDGLVSSDITWRSRPLEFKDTIQHAFAYGTIMIVSWLANREIGHSLERARKSEANLKSERDLLEVKVEERTRELKATQLEKVSQLYRFAEFGRLASGIYHDLLNPLTAVSLSVERLQDDAGIQSAEARGHIDKAIRASRRMDSFLHTVRKQLASESTEAVFSPAKEIHDAVDILSHKARSNHIAVHADVDEEVTLHGSPTKFFQIVVNLLSNAMDSYRGYVATDLCVNISLRTDNDSILLIIEDRGCGIALAQQKSVFEPFFTTKTKHSGIGLGLSTTKQIIEKDFKGAILLQSTEGEGTSFTVRIPFPTH